MNQSLIHVYFMPGMAANPSIFEYIKLPEESFEIHWLEWMIPESNETLEAYAKRMIDKIEYDNVALLGVSFGGILVQEMSKHMDLKRLIVVSSVKSYHELPRRLKVLKYTKAYKLLPTQLVSYVDFFSNYPVGKTVKKRMNLYKKYLSVSDKRYLDWAIEKVVLWDQEEPNPEAIYIHGDSDLIFPHSCQGNCIIVEGGSHIMILNKYKWFNENLPKLIASGI